MTSGRTLGNQGDNVFWKDIFGRLGRKFLIVVACYFPANAKAQGLFDFLDPCIGAKNAFWQEREAILNNINFQIEATNSDFPSNTFRQWWWGEKRASLVPYFDREIWPILAQSGATNKFAAFDAWVQRQKINAGGDAKLESLMTNEYRRLRQLILKKQQNATLVQLDQARQQLYGACPADVANQVFRGIQVIVGAPVGAVSRNLEISRRESGEIARGLAATTGVSTSDIQRYGPLGGQNSEARRACNGIAGVFGGKC